MPPVSDHVTSRDPDHAHQGDVVCHPKTNTTCFTCVQNLTTVASAVPDIGLQLMSDDPEKKN